MATTAEKRAKAQSNEPNEWLTVPQVANRLGYSVNYLRNLIWQRRLSLPFYKPRGGKILFKRQEVDAFVEKGLVV